MPTPFPEPSAPPATPSPPESTRRSAFARRFGSSFWLLGLLALRTGMAGEAQFSDDSVLDPVTVALRKRVHIERDESVGRVQSRIAIQLKDGRKLERHVEHALGTLERPMSDADLEAKFRGLADGILSKKQADEVIRLCWTVETLPDAGAIARAASA